MRPLRPLLLLSVLTAAAGGCASSGPLGGTAWRVERLTTANELDYAQIYVEMAPNGEIVTTTVGTDGTIAVSRSEQYHVHEGVMRIVHPDYAYDALYRRDPSGRLELVSWDFFMVLEPVAATAIPRP